MTASDCQENVHVILTVRQPSDFLLVKQICLTDKKCLTSQREGKKLRYIYTLLSRCQHKKQKKNKKMIYLLSSSLLGLSCLPKLFTCHRRCIGKCKSVDGKFILITGNIQSSRLLFFMRLSSMKNKTQTEKNIVINPKIVENTAAFYTKFLLIKSKNLEETIFINLCIKRMFICTKSLYYKINLTLL